MPWSRRRRLSSDGMSSILEHKGGILPDEHLTIAAAVGAFVIKTAEVEVKIDHVLLLMVDVLETEVLSVSPRFPTKHSEKIKTLLRVLSLSPLAEKASVRDFLARSSEQTFANLFSVRHIVCHGKIVNVGGRRGGYRIDLEKVDPPRREGGRQTVRYKRQTVTTAELRENIRHLSEILEDLENIRLEVWKLFSGWPRFLADNQRSPFSAEAALSVLDGA